MADKIEIRARIQFWKTALESLREAYLALLEGGVKSYRLRDRELTKLDLPALKNEIAAAEKKVDELEARLAGGAKRKAVAVIPRDW